MYKEWEEKLIALIQLMCLLRWVYENKPMQYALLCGMVKSKPEMFPSLSDLITTWRSAGLIDRLQERRERNITSYDNSEEDRVIYLADQLRNWGREFTNKQTTNKL